MSVVRHAIADVIDSPETDIQAMSVHSFTNDYASMRIRLNTTPIVIHKDGINLASTLRSLDLHSIERLLSLGVSPEAVEIDRSGDLFFYGRVTESSKLSGVQLSLADLAVIYRAVFHCGDNTPYVSLDQNEDNRFAKVNFGGLLEDTHAGGVLLEADKQFKAISTGLDPNTLRPLNTAVSRTVPGFLTEDERSLLGVFTEGSSRLRYWFYPDSISTVTDGKIGAVLSHQFMADVERQDSPETVDAAVRQTINHLNAHYPHYETALPALRELSTLGKCLALMTWLKEMGAPKRTNLDDFLSVWLPAYTTPRQTQKMLAVSIAAMPRHGNLSSSSIREHSQTFHASHLLEGFAPGVSDEMILAAISSFGDSIDISHLLPGEVTSLERRLHQLRTSIDAVEKTTSRLEEEIQRSKLMLDRTSERAIYRHNMLIDEFNNAITQQEVFIAEYNSTAARFNAYDHRTLKLVSVGGGIDFRPEGLKPPLRSRNAPILRELRSLKETVHQPPTAWKRGSIVRSEVVRRGPRVNPLPAFPSDPWKVGRLHDREGATARQSLSLSFISEGPDWRVDIFVGDATHSACSVNRGRSLVVSHPGLFSSANGVLSADRKTIAFRH